MITASIVTYNTDKEMLRTLLSCVATSSIDKLYLIDNSPTDRLREFETVSLKMEYCFGQGNIGYGAAHNIALRKSMDLGAIYHVILNPDIRFGQGVIDSLRIYMDANPTVGLVMPNVVYPDYQQQYLCKLLPSPLDLIGRRFLPFRQYVQRRNLKFEMRGSQYDKTMFVPFLSGCFMFLRMEALKKVGSGFDDRFFMYCEDLDLCRRLIMSGYQNMFYPDVTIIHAHQKASYHSSKMLRMHIMSAIRYFNKWGWVFDRYRGNINKLATQQYE